MAKAQLTNYEANQQMYAKLDAPDEAELNTKFANVGAWLSFRMKHSYFMLLCRERNDYTMIHVNNFNFDAAVQELREILESRGEIIDIDYQHGQDNYLCWVRERVSPETQEMLDDIGDNIYLPQVWAYVFFEADDFVVEAGE